MDGAGAPRANAAQLASRNIKQLKGRRGGARASPVPSSPATFGSSQTGQSFQFQPPPGASTGGGFNFATPANGSFNNPFANSSNGAAPMSENDERRDPAEEPFGKRGRHVNGDDGDQVPLFAPMPSDTFGTSTSGQQSGGMFSGFGQSNGLNGGQPAAPASTTPFAGFGQSSTANAPFSPAPGPQASNSFNFSFGAPAASPQPQTASASFPPFNQTPSQPKSTGFQFGATPAAATPSSNLFGTSQAPSTNLFGSKPSSPALPATDLFGKKESSPAPTAHPFGTSSQKPATNLFGGSTPAASNPFGSRDASPAPTTSTPNLFGSQPSASNPFSSSVPAANHMFSKPPSTTAEAPNTQKPFASSTMPSTSNLFSSSAPAPNNLFGSRDPSPALSANGSVQAPSTEQTPKPSLLFGQQSQENSPKPATTPLFGSTVQASTTLFGAQKPQSTPLFGSLGQNTVAGDTPKAATTSFASNSLFGSTPKANGTELFGALNKPVDKSVTDPKPGTSFSFGESAATTPQPSTLLGQQGTAQSPAKPVTSSVSDLSTSEAAKHQTSPTNVVKAIPSKPSFSFAPSSAAPPPAPQPAKASLSSQTSSQTPLKLGNTPAAGMFSQSQPSASAGDNQQSNRPAVNGVHEPGSIGESVERLKNAKPSDQPSHDGADFADLSIASQIPEEFMRDLVPAEFSESQRRDFYCAYRLRALNKAMSIYFGGLQSGADPSNAMKFYSEQRKSFTDEIKSRNSKPQQNTTRAEAMANQQAKANESMRSRTSNQPSTSPAKSQPSDSVPSTQPARANGDFSSASTSRPASNLFSSSVPNLPHPTSQQGASTSKGKRKAEDELDQNNVDQHNKRPMRKIATPKSNGTTFSPGGSKTSNIFRDILDSPLDATDSSPAKKAVATPSSSAATASTTPKANPFGSMFVPKSPGKNDAAGPPPSNLFSSQPVNSPKKSNTIPSTSGIFGSQTEGTPTASTSTAPSGFAGFKPSGSTSSPAPAGFKLAGVNPASAVNFASQFGKQAEQSKAKELEKEMQDAMDEDMESDEDEEEWKAKWKANREAKLKEQKAAAAPASTFSFKPSMSISANKSSSPVDSATPAKASFGSSSLAPQTVGLFGSSDLSRTNSPSPAPSSSSIFDNQGSGKPATLGNNIFGHLSKSAEDSGKDNDADDESEEEAEIDADSENKDPNYTPGKDNSGPGTPAEETGPGIASAKKSNLFNFSTSKPGSAFGVSPSGTSTPGGSLFGRITRDTSAKPPSPSSEEKENTQPANTGLFSALSKSQNGPIDQTWKPDSPIKFGNATPTSDSKSLAPTVNITAATPTKSAGTGLFGNLNSSTTPTSAPFSNLFGASTATKSTAPASVGFNFGGPSNTSSLFPSATTSRATTPGATTDGDSAAEDPDAEKHEQISLTSGAGEEDEDVQLEVRAKAMQFLPKADGTSGWETKGLGVLKVLKHKETGDSRVLMRAEPRGNIVLNKGILGQFKYEATAKTVKLTTAGEVGKGLETWILQVKTPESAKELAEALEANKAA